MTDAERTDEAIARLGDSVSALERAIYALEAKMDRLDAEVAS